jgi:hypothetical protein
MHWWTRGGGFRLSESNVTALRPASRHFKCSFASTRKSCFRSFNAIFGKVEHRASEEFILQLVKTKCLPTLLYGLEACPLNSADERSLVFVKLFNQRCSQVPEWQVQVQVLKCQVTSSSTVQVLVHSSYSHSNCHLRKGKIYLAHRNLNRNFLGSNKKILRVWD